jgi:hypothetical protein
MDAHHDLAMAMLAVLSSAVLLVTGLLYIQHPGTRDVPVAAIQTPRADIKEGVDIRLASEQSPYMRSER